MLRSTLGPLRLSAALALHVTRLAALVATRSARRWELIVERALAEPVLLRGWQGADECVADPRTHRRPSRPEAEGSEDLTDDGLDSAESAHRPPLVALLRRRFERAEPPVG